MAQNKYHYIIYGVYFHNKFVWRHKLLIIFTLNLIMLKLV